MADALPPLPVFDEINAPWFEGLRAHELRIQKCAGCGRLRHTPRPMCPGCNETEHGFERMSGRGRIWSFVVAHPPLPPGFAARVPMPVALVELDEDPTIRVVGALAPGTDPAAVVIGAAVEAVFERVTDALTLANWRLL
jgi:hypothetical protein